MGEEARVCVQLACREWEKGAATKVGYEFRNAMPATGGRHTASVWSNTTDSVPRAGVRLALCTVYPRPGKSPRRLYQTLLDPFTIQPADSAMMSLLVLIHDSHVQLSRQFQNQNFSPQFCWKDWSVELVKLFRCSTLGCVVFHPSCCDFLCPYCPGHLPSDLGPNLTFGHARTHKPSHTRSDTSQRYLHARRNTVQTTQAPPEARPHRHRILFNLRNGRQRRSRLPVPLAVPVPSPETANSTPATSRLESRSWQRRFR